MGYGLAGEHSVSTSVLPLLPSHVIENGFKMGMITASLQGGAGVLEEYDILLGGGRVSYSWLILQFCD